MEKLSGKLFSSLIAVLIVISSLPLLNPGTVNAATTGITLSGTCHVQDYGDTAGSWDAATGILTLGTRGQSKRVEAITINLENTTGYSGTLQYRVHVQDIGWQDYRSAGEMAGTSGQSKRLEGIEMYLTGELAQYYTVEYAVHIQDYGDNQGFVSDGALAGTTGESKRLEEVQVRIVPRGQGTSTSVNYRVHRQDYGWESTWAKDGAESGTTGQSKRLEGIEIHLTGNQYSGSIQYRTHVQNIGWESAWSKDGEMSGTQGMSYRLEGIEIELTGDIANYYDVYYRVHAQDYGWLGWAKNGQMSGTSGMSKRLEAIQIVLVAKGGAAPGNVAGVSSVMGEPSVIDGVPTTPSVPASGGSSTPSAGPSEPSSSTQDEEHNWVDLGIRISTEGITHIWKCADCPDFKTEFIPNTKAPSSSGTELVYTLERWAIRPYWTNYYDYAYDPTSYASVVKDSDGNVVFDNTDEIIDKSYDNVLLFLKNNYDLSFDRADLNNVNWLYSKQYYYSDGSIKDSELDYYVQYYLVEAQFADNVDYNGWSGQYLKQNIDILGIATDVYDADGTLISSDHQEVVDDMYKRADAFLASLGYEYGCDGYWGYAITTDYYYTDGSVQAMSGVYRGYSGQVFVPPSFVHTLIKNAS